MVELARISRESSLQRSARTESDQGHATAIQPGRHYNDVTAINDVTNVDSASRGSERRMQRICLRTPKHELTSQVRWASIDMSLLRRTPRSRTLSTGATETEPTVSWSVGSWCCCLGGTHHMNSVFAAFSWSRLGDTQLATERIQLPRSQHSDAELLGRQTL